MHRRLSPTDDRGSSNVSQGPKVVGDAVLQCLPPTTERKKRTASVFIFAAFYMLLYTLHSLYMYAYMRS